MNHFRFYSRLQIILIAAIILSLAGCSSLPGGQPASGKVLQSQLERQKSPDVSAEELQAQVAGNSAFALDFYQATRAAPGNLFASPYSLSLALAMTYAGARGDTQTQMAQTLHFDLPQERLHPAFNRLDLQLAAPVQEDKNQQAFQLSIANSLWGEQSYTFLPEFLDALALNYGAGLRLMDFKGSPEPARKVINDWVYQQTMEKIKDLIPQGGIDSSTRLVLANAIYFKADWLMPFAKEQTGDAPFTLLDGSQVSAPMMSYLRPESLGYVLGSGYQAVELPYVGNTASMVVIVPDQGSFEAFEAGFDSPKLAEIITALQPTIVALQLPKFKFESSYGLKQTLEAMGMLVAFEAGQADFSGMDGTQNLYIGNVYHKAFVAVDEKGAEAAAASAVVMMKNSIMVDMISLTVDRPFIFLIHDRQSGTILFLGRVVNPVL
ncbi:MAG: serpin family protein [Anaerolineales bacterium]|nr:serpin family protein [Anaerolineales bacterium]